MAEIGTDVLFTIVKPELHYKAYNEPAPQDEEGHGDGWLCSKTFTESGICSSL